MRAITRHIILLLFLFLWGIGPMRLWAQQGHFSAIPSVQHNIEASLDMDGFCRFSAVKPMLEKQLMLYRPDSFPYLGIKALNRPINILDYRKKKYRVLLNPYADMVAGAGTNHLHFYGGASVGIDAKIDLGRNFSLGGYGRFSQMSYPDYINNMISRNRVVPGMGYARKSSAGGYCFWDWDVYANYEFLKYFNVEAGMGRNFWGDGYRSFFLSDNAFSYPYLKITTSVWKIKYVNLYAQMKDMRQTGSGKWSNMSTKYGSFHFLSWDVSKRINIGFFEAIIWEAGDTSANRGFDINYLNPLIFYRPVEFSIGSPDNSLLGISMKVKIAKKNFLYGQFLMDDIIIGELTSGSINRIKHWFNPEDSSLPYGYWTNKQAWQLGFKKYDLFRVEDLDLQLEYNSARPYTFSHRRPIVNYGHYNEPLSHPAGANFWEILAFLRYRMPQGWFFEGQFMYLKTGLDSAGTHYGQDIWQSTFDTYYPELNNIPVTQYGNNIGQGVASRIYYGAFRAGFLLIPSMNLRIETELAYRRQTSVLLSSGGAYFTLGIKTSTFGVRTDR